VTFLLQSVGPSGLSHHAASADPPSATAPKPRMRPRREGFTSGAARSVTCFPCARLCPSPWRSREKSLASFIGSSGIGGIVDERRGSGAIEAERVGGAGRASGATETGFVGGRESALGAVDRFFGSCDGRPHLMHPSDISGSKRSP